MSPNSSNLNSSNLTGTHMHVSGAAPLRQQVFRVRVNRLKHLHIGWELANFGCTLGRKRPTCIFPLDGNGLGCMSMKQANHTLNLRPVVGVRPVFYCLLVRIPSARIATRRNRNRSFRLRGNSQADQPPGHLISERTERLALVSGWWWPTTNSNAL